MLCKVEPDRHAPRIRVRMVSGISGTPVESEELPSLESKPAQHVAPGSERLPLNGVDVPVNKMPFAWTGRIRDAVRTWLELLQNLFAQCDKLFVIRS